MKKAVTMLATMLILVLSLGAQFKPAADIGQVVNARTVLQTNDPTGGFNFSADSKTLWLSAGRKAMEYEVATGNLLKTLDFHSSDNPDWHMVPITSMIANRDRSIMATGDRDGNIKFWEPESGKVLGTIATVSQGSPIRSLRFNPADDTLASCNRSRTIYLWDVKSRRKKATLDTGDNSTFEAVRYTPNGQSLVTMDNAGRVRFYNAATGVLQKTYPVSTAIETFNKSLFISPNGQVLATGGNKQAYIYDSATGKLKFTLAHEGAVVGVAFSLDNKWIATASHDKTVKLWDAATGKIKATFEGHIGIVNNVALSPDAKTLVTGAEGEGRLWDIP